MAKKRSAKNQQAPAIKDIMFSGQDMCIIFKDSSRLIVPVDSIDFLKDADIQTRCDCNPCDKGSAIAWSKLDKKITLEEILEKIEE